MRKRAAFEQAIRALVLTAARARLHRPNLPHVAVSLRVMASLAHCVSSTSSIAAFQRRHGALTAGLPCFHAASTSVPEQRREQEGPAIPGARRAPLVGLREREGHEPLPERLARE